MGIFLVLVAVVLLIWIARKLGKGATTPAARPTERRPLQVVVTVSGGDEAISRPSKSVRAEDCWLPPGQEIAVAGYRIRGGMVYVGKGLASINGLRIEPALIDPTVSVDRANADRAGASMTYWPSYSSISPEARAAYLEWLATGRRDPSAYIGYVFLFFYGLERRALAEAPKSSVAKEEEIAAIRREVEQLLDVYGGNDSFRRYAAQLLDVLDATSGSQEPVEPILDRIGYEVPLTTRVGIGRIISTGKPIPPEWAWNWYLTHPDTGSRVRTLMRRCPREFSELFRTRYAREYGDGLTVKPSQTTLRMSITPASASFGGQMDVSLDLPDISVLTAPLSKIRKIGENSATDLDAYSRWVGRNNEAPKTVAAVALLPAELATTHDSEEASRLWQWVKATVGSSELAICSTNDLLQHCSSFGAGKLAKSEAVLLAQLLEKGGYGVEPDVRFGGAPLAPGGTGVLFKVPTGSAAVASPEYAAATVLLHLAIAISAADGTISESEEEHLQEHLQRSLIASEAERIRLRAHLVWLMKSPPALTGLRKRLDPLDQRQRTAIADFIIGVAGADGHISPDEIKTLGKVYPMLGLAGDDVYSHVHAMAAGGAAATEPIQPVTVIPAVPSTGFAIPSRPSEPNAVQLDMTAVKAKLAQSAQISAILDDIFTEEEAPVPIRPILESRDGKLPSSYAALLLRLVERPEWTRSEFEELVAEIQLMPDGAIDTLNEAAFDHVGGPVLDGDDPIQIDTAVAKELLV